MVLRQSATSRMSVLMLFFWGAIITVEGFMVPYLSSIGFSERRAGLIMAALYIVSVGSTPLWGYLADRTDRHRSIVAVALIVSVGAVIAIGGSGTVFALIISFALLYSLTAMSMPALIDSWIMRMNQSESPVNYGIARGFGSLGYALAGAGLGILYEARGLQLLFPSYAILMSVVVVVAMTTGRRKLSAGVPTLSAKEPALPTAVSELAPRSPGAVRSILTNGRYIVLLVSLFFLLVGTRAAVTFIPLRLYALGGTTAHVGWFQTVNAASEIPFMFLSALVLRRIRPRLLILIGMVIFVLRLVLVRIAPTPGLILAAQVLQGPAFGFMLPAVVHYIDRIAPRHLQSLFQTLAPSVYFGLASVVGSASGGVVIERYGLDALYTVAPIVTALGALIFGVSLLLRRSPPGSANI